MLKFLCKMSVLFSAQKRQIWICWYKGKYEYPTDTRRNDNAFVTLNRCRFDAIMPLLLRRVSVVYVDFTLGLSIGFPSTRPLLEQNVVLGVHHRPHSRQVTGARCTGGRGSPLQHGEVRDTNLAWVRPVVSTTMQFFRKYMCKNIDVICFMRENIDLHCCSSCCCYCCDIFA